jgi:hypothetical protein
MKIKSIVVGSIAVYLGAVALLAPLGTAWATYRTHHGSLCHYFDDTQGVGMYSGAYLGNTTGSTKGVYCPVMSDDYLDINAVTTVTVDVTEGVDGGFSRVCRADYFGWSTTCGVQYNWVAGNTQAFPSVATWNDAFDYGYLYHSVTNNSRIYGYSLWE